MTNLEAFLEVLVSRNNRCGRHRSAWGLSQASAHRQRRAAWRGNNRVGKADFDDYVLPKLSDNSELSDSEDVTGVAGSELANRLHCGVFSLYHQAFYRHL